MKKRISIMLLPVVSMLMFSFSLAAEEVPMSSTGLPDIAEWYIYLGDHKGKETPGLVHPVAQFSLGLGIGFQYNKNVHLDIELIGVEKEYDTPPSITGGWFTSIDDDMNLSSTGLCLNARFKQSLGKLEVYAGAGLGMFWSSLSLTGSTFGLPASHDEKSTDVGFQGIVGVGYQFAVSNINLEYRQLNLDANFMAITGVNKNDVGGELILLVYRGKF